MAPLVVTVTRAELEARREEILRSLGSTLEEFRHLEETRTLTGEEWEVREELDEIEFLLGASG